MPALQADSLADLAFPQFLRLALKKAAVIHYKETDGRELWLDEEASVLHTKLRQLQTRLGEHLPPLAGVHFLDTGVSDPYSREVAEALDILQQSGAINRENPQYRWLCPPVLGDTVEAVDAEIVRLFPADSPERGAFEKVVEGLFELKREV